MRLLPVTASRLGTIQPVRFGISAEQRNSVNSISAAYQGSIENRDSINELLGQYNLSGLAHFYAASDTPSDKLGPIEEALVIAFNRGTKEFEKNQGDGNYSLSGIADALDSGRLQGQALPDRVQTAFEEATRAYHEMLTRTGH
jgi:hypothetical protein